MHAEEISGIPPNAARHPPRRAGKILKLANRIFVRVLGLDGLAAEEPEPAAPDACRLVFDTDKVHFDSAFAGVVDCFVTEAIESEGAVELAVDPRQEIEVEGGGHAILVIVSAHKRAG